MTTCIQTLTPRVNFRLPSGVAPGAVVPDRRAEPIMVGRGGRGRRTCHFLHAWQVSDKNFELSYPRAALMHGENRGDRGG